MTKSKIIQDWVIVILCIFGFAAHLISVSEQYFKFEIETEIETNFAEHDLIIPDLSFCNYIIDLIDEKKLLKTDFKQLLIKNEVIKDGEESDEEFNEGFFKDLLRNGSIFKLFEDHFDTYTILNELTYSSDLVFSSIKYLVDNSTFIGLDDEVKCNITTYSQMRDICFSVICPYDSLPRNKFNVFTNRNTLLKSTYKNTLVRLKLNQTTLTQIKSPFVVFIFENGLAFTYKAITQTSISLLSDSDSPSQYDITYQRFENQRLPPPYTTKCLEYSKLGFKSRNEKIEFCINQKIQDYQELRNRVFFGNIVENNVKNIHFDIYRQNVNMTARSEIDYLLNMIFDNCTKENSQKECYSQNFLPYLLKQRILKKDNEFSIVHLLATTLPEIKNTAKQKFSLKNLLVFCSSVISFWFGLTIYSISYFSCEIVKAIRRKIDSFRDEERRKELVLKAKNKLLLGMRKNRVVSNKDVEPVPNFVKMKENQEKANSSFIESMTITRSPVLTTMNTTGSTITANSTQSNLQRARRKSSIFLNEHIINIPNTIA